MRLIRQYNLSVIDILRIVVAALIVKVTVGVVLNYTNYLPPNFESEFLLGRRPHFFGSYAIAFYAHIVTGPLTLLLGMLLVSHRFRHRYRDWHARLGRVQAAVVLFVSISGLWMSRHAATGSVAGVGFACLAIATSCFVFQGIRAATLRRFTEHERWMWRCFLCLCSAVVLRLTAGLSLVTDIGGNWIYPLSAWACWLVPLGVYEFHRMRRAGSRRTWCESGIA